MTDRTKALEVARGVWAQAQRAMWERSLSEGHVEAAYRVVADALLDAREAGRREERERLFRAHECPIGGPCEVCALCPELMDDMQAALHGRTPNPPGEPERCPDE